MISEPILRGRAHRIVYIETGTGSAETFQQFARQLRAKGPLASQLLGKEQGAKNRPRDWKKLLAIMKRVCDPGLDVVATNPLVCKRFKGSDSGLGEFKSIPFRVMFFECGRVPGRIVITHCFKKKSDKTPPQQVERAHRLREAYYQWIDRHS